MTLQLRSLYQRISKIVYKLGPFLTTEKKVTSNFCKIIAQFCCCQYVAKFLKELFSTQCLNFLKKIVCPHQPEFLLSDSCQSQLLSIVCDIYASFDWSPTLEVRANFLDIPKAFDKVWHEGLLFKLECIGISGNLLHLLKSFLNNRFQRVVLNGQCSNWSSVLASIPQDSILWPLSFLIYINDFPDGLEYTVKLFADDTSLLSTAYDPNMSADQLDNNLKKNSEWAYK